MQVKKENFLKDELNVEFKVDKKYCCCCNKTIAIYFVLTEDKLLFYKDKERTILYLEILTKLVLAINRRFRTEADKNKLSIYYLERETSLIIKELKLKASSKIDMEKWIYVLNKIIKPKRDKFHKIFSNNYVKSNDLFKFKDESNFYIALCNLEYILLKNKLRCIFDIYHNLSESLITRNTINSFNEEELLNEK